MAIIAARPQRNEVSAPCGEVNASIWNYGDMTAFTILALRTREDAPRACSGSAPRPAACSMTMSGQIAVSVDRIQRAHKFQANFNIPCTGLSATLTCGASRSAASIAKMVNALGSNIH